MRAPLEAVFDFFSQAQNLEVITPKSLRFKILTALPIEMRPGALIEYKLKVLGVPFLWLTEIKDWDPPKCFVDVQKKGPYLLWEHEHHFEPAAEGTFVEDRLRYAVPGGILEKIIHRLFVRPQVERIFDHRAKVIEEFFAEP